jgi:phenylacetate-coenzyme A ligase PaaK-like adenylate-forming protein
MNIENLRSVFNEAYENAHTDFYRTLYAAQNFVPSTGFPQDIKEWETLPLLSKEDLMRVPVEQRTFIPKEEVLFYRTSSGTSNRGTVIIPRNFVPDRARQASFTKRFLDFLTPHHFHDVSARRSGIELMQGDTSDLAATAKLASRFSIDGISAPSSILLAFIPHLLAEMDTSQIRYVFLWGERISPVRREIFFRTFPNALIEADYALSEVHGIGAISCMEMIRAHEFFVHPRSELIYWELIDPDTGMVSPEEGEVVITSLWSNNAYPPIRYRTGDLARKVDFPCSCGLASYEILGRVRFDRLIIPGGLITSEELEKALWLYRDHIEDDFELHVYEEKDARMRFELHVRPLAGSKLDAEVIAQNVSQSLRISAQRTLADALRSGLVAEIKCVLLPSGIVPAKKQLRIFTH